jgi:hypothetical protein
MMIADRAAEMILEDAKQADGGLHRTPMSL